MTTAINDPTKPTWSQRVADKVSSVVGSWRFICIQSVVLLTWIVLNVTGIINWDVYPFILLNLGLSFQAAYATPILLMSQGRQSAIDRCTLEADLEANMRELEKLDAIEIRLSEHIEARMAEVGMQLSKLISELHAQKEPTAMLPTVVKPSRPRK